MNVEEAWNKYCFAETGITGIQMKSSAFGKGFLEGWNAAIRQAILLAEGNEEVIKELKERELK
jgi:hypothetical protein